MFRILFWNHSIHIGGAERSLLDILKFIDKNRFYPLVISSQEGPFLKAVKELGIETRIVSISRPVSRLSRAKLNIVDAIFGLFFGGRSIFLMSRLVRKERIDLIYSNSLKADILAVPVKLFTGRKLIWHIRDILPSGPIKIIFQILGRLFAEQIIVNSDFTARQFKELPGLSIRVKRIYNGVDTDVFKPKQQAELKRRMGLDRFSSIVGIFSMFTPWKGHRCFIEAAGLVSQELPRVGFLLVGDEIYDTDSVRSGYKQELIALANKKASQDNFIFTGYQDNIADWVNLCDIVVSTSLEPEPFGRTAIEAMACAKPVIAPENGGFLETVEPGKTGFLFRPGDYQCLAKQIVYLLNNRNICLEMGGLGLQTVKKQFGSRTSVLDIENEILSALFFKGRRHLPDLEYLRRIILRWVNKIFGRFVCIFLKKISFLENKKKIERIKKVIFLKLAGMGDGVLVLPSIKLFKEKFPDVHICVLATKELEGIFSGKDFIDEIIIYDLYGKDSGIFGFLKLICKICKKRFDCSVDFEQHLYLTTILTYLSRVPKRVGFFHPLHRRDYLLSDPVEFNDQKHMADTFLDLIRIFVPQADIKQLERITVTEQDRKYAGDLLKGLRLNDKYLIVGIHPGTSRRARTRRWQEEKFAHLADRLISDLDAKIVFTGSSLDRGSIEKIIKVMKAGARNLAGRTNLKQMAALLENFDLFISSDTGPLHLSAAMGTVTIGLYGPNTPLRYAPFGDKHLALYARQSCSPCINIHLGEIKDCLEPVCMKNLSVDEVYLKVSEKIRDVLKKGRR